MKRSLTILLAPLLLGLTQCTKEVTEPKDTDALKNMKSMEIMGNLKKEYVAHLSALNNSGVSGTATLMLNGDQLTVTINAAGLMPNRVHPQHIHGFMENNSNSVCPPPAADTDGDGLVELGEGVPFYGPVLLELAPFPTANAQGMISYQRTFTVDKSLLPLQNRTIVLHGMDVMGQYWATLPVACGQIMVAGE